jgi:hypothetical protein
VWLKTLGSQRWEILPDQVRKNCPNKSGNHPLPPGIVVPLEWPYRVREPHKGELSNVGTGEGFAEDAHKDQRWEGGVIGQEPVETSS